MQTDVYQRILEYTLGYTRKCYVYVELHCYLLSPFVWPLTPTMMADVAADS